MDAERDAAVRDLAFPATLIRRRDFKRDDCAVHSVSQRVRYQKGVSAEKLDFVFVEVVSVALLNAVDGGLANGEIFDVAREVIANENAAGPFWPLILEWHSRRWPDFQLVDLSNDLVRELAARNVTLFDANRLPPVFSELEEREFAGVTRAIEIRVSQYDDDDGDDDQDDDDDHEAF